MKASTNASTTQAFLAWLEELLADGVRMSDAAIARHMGTNQSTVHRWRQGQVGPSPEILRRASQELNIPILVMYVKAGYLTEDEANLQIFESTLDGFSFEALLEEIGRRYRSVARERDVSANVLSAFSKSGALSAS